MRYFCGIVVTLLTLASVVSVGDDQDVASDLATDMALIDAWLGGIYDNREQIAAELSNDLPTDQRPTPLHQVVMPVEIEDFKGLTFFSQLTRDGTVDTLLGVGIYHFYPDVSAGKVVMRLRMMDDSTRFINAHRKPKILENLTMSDVHWTEGCEFYFSRSADGHSLEGVMKENSCFPISRNFGRKIQHIDEIIIRPGEFWNNARYYELDGTWLFGNASNGYVKQVRIEEEN